jgi:hypothetical protein
MVGDGSEKERPRNNVILFSKNLSKVNNMQKQIDAIKVFVRNLIP